MNLSDSPLLVPFLSEPSFLEFLVSYILVRHSPLPWLRGSPSLLAEPGCNSRRSGIDAFVKSHQLVVGMRCSVISADPCHPVDLNYFPYFVPSDTIKVGHVFFPCAVPYDRPTTSPCVATSSRGVRPGSILGFQSQRRANTKRRSSFLI